jgi:hypothetical protein
MSKGKDVVVVVAIIFLALGLFFEFFSKNIFGPNQILGPILALVSILISLFLFNAKRAENLQENKFTEIRKTVEAMGVPETESKEITENVVRILKFGPGGHITYGLDDGSTLGKMLEAPLSEANWTKFKPSDLSSAIDLALKMRDRRQNW